MKRIKVIAALAVLCLLTACSAAPAEESTPTLLLPTEPPEQQQRTELPEPSNQKLLVINEKFLTIPASENITFYESLSGENTIPDPRVRYDFSPVYESLYVAEPRNGISIVKGGNLSEPIFFKKDQVSYISAMPDYYCKTTDLQEIDLVNYLFSVSLTSPDFCKIEFEDGSYLIYVYISDPISIFANTYYFDAEGRIITVFHCVNPKYAYKYDWNDDGIEDLFFLTGSWKEEFSPYQFIVRNAEEDRKALNTEYVESDLIGSFIVYMSSKSVPIDFSAYGVFPIDGNKLEGSDKELKRNPFYSMESLSAFMEELYFVGSDPYYSINS